MTIITLTKHHGLGNDFLVFVSDQPEPFGEEHVALARAVCDRRRGVGADGLLLAAPVEPRAADGAQVSMVLLNADGSRAEMSGNGIRCFAQAWASHTAMSTGTLRVRTDAGVRAVTIEPTDDPSTISASVTMGAVAPLAEPSNWSALACDPLRPVSHLSLGNPHSVVAVDDVWAIDLASLGGEVPQINLEIVQPGPEPDSITMRVHERGAGITEACGTGACAAAYASARWGLVSPQTTEITVHMDGGDAKVRLDDPRPGEVTLVGPATFVASIIFDTERLGATAGVPLTAVHR